MNFNSTKFLNIITLSKDTSPLKLTGVGREPNNQILQLLRNLKEEVKANLGWNTHGLTDRKRDVTLAMRYTDTAVSEMYLQNPEHPKENMLLWKNYV